MHVAIITGNPKVRDFKYNIKLKFGRSLEGLAVFCRSKFKCDFALLKKFMRKLMYEFNNSKSKQLEQFYNPEEDKQQESFSNMVRFYLSPFLSDTGVEITLVRFSLP